MELTGLGRRGRVPSQSNSGASDVALNVESRTESSQIGTPVADQFVRNNPVIPLPVPAVPSPGWREYLFIIPILSMCVSVVAATFGIKNYFFLEAQKTLGFVKTLSPVLRSAHADILTKLGEIAEILKNNTCDR